MAALRSGARSFQSIFDKKKVKKNKQNVGLWFSHETTRKNSWSRKNMAERVLSLLLIQQWTHKKKIRIYIVLKYFFALSSGEWGKTKLELTTLARIFMHTCRASILLNCLRASLTCPSVPTTMAIACIVLRRKGALFYWRTYFWTTPPLPPPLIRYRRDISSPCFDTDLRCS